MSNKYSPWGEAIAVMIVILVLMIVFSTSVITP